VVEQLPSISKALGLIPSTAKKQLNKKPGMVVVHACHPST
jgi:hypothetical protein